MTNAFGYIRVSGNSQTDGDGFPRQRAAITAYAEAHGFVITEWFEERAVPGKTEWTDRPAWVEMCLRFNGIRTVLCEKLDRLARDLMVQEHIIADLKRREIQLIPIMEPDLCSDDPSRKLLRQIMGAIAEYDRAMICAKLSGARNRKKLATGRCEGRKPFGYRDGESAALEIMNNMRKEGFDYAHIAARLDALGHKTRLGGEWGPATVAKILSRRIGQAPRGETEEERSAIDRIRELRASGKSQRGIARILNDEGRKTRRGTPWVHQYVAAVLGTKKVTA